MVPTGDPTQATVDELAGLLAAGDVVVDGGNSNYRDSMAAAQPSAPRASASSTRASVAASGAWTTATA